MDEKIEVIYGPIAPTLCGGVIYSVTLGNGYPVTSPSGFAIEPNEASVVQSRPLPFAPAPT